jgi:hypothetical protein
VRVQFFAKLQYFLLFSHYSEIDFKLQR